MKITMSWAPQHQSIALGEEEFSHQGPISTDPSHDLAHLIVGASGNLPWAPVGNSVTTRMAEYNAILVEHLLTNAYDCIVTRSWNEHPALLKTISHAKWFVEQHYAPFPVSAEQALSEFTRLADSEVILRLAPHFFRQKQAERNDRNFRERSWHLTAEITATPVIEDPAERRFIELVARQLSKLRGLITSGEFKGDTALKDFHGQAKLRESKEA